MKKHIYKTRVRYAEVDQMGVVYYANYFLYMESGRTGLLRDEGYPYTRIEDEGMLMPITETKLQYKSSAKYDDKILVETTIGYIRNASIRINYIIKKEDNTIIAKGYTVHPVVDREFKIVDVPENLKKILEPYIDNN
jgi:acyl-CoA thioester hydrolase